MNSNFYKKCRDDKYQESIKYMVHCLDQDRNQGIILEIYKVNVFLALKCTATQEKNLCLENILLEKINTDMKIKDKPSKYKISMLLGLYYFQRRDGAIKYLKELNETISNKELENLVWYLYKIADSDTIIQLFLDAISTEGDKITSKLISSDKNKILYCDKSEAIIKKYINDCFYKNKYKNLAIFMDNYEEQINFFELIGVNPNDYLPMLFDDKDIESHKHERKIVNEVLSKDIYDILKTFYNYSNSDSAFDLRIAHKIAKKLIESNEILAQNDLEKIKRVVNTKFSSSARKTQRKIRIIDRFIDNLEYKECNAISKLYTLENSNPYYIFEKKRKINIYQNDCDLNNEVIKNVVDDLIYSINGLKELIYIYFNTKLCEQCCLETFIQRIKLIKSCSINDIIEEISKYRLFGYIKQINKVQAVIRCINVNVVKLMYLKLDDINSKQQIKENMKIDFYISKYENGYFNIIL